jgi:two-component system cell cycle sensor histidine kinase PleC
MIACNQLGQVTADLEFRNQEYRDACTRAESANAAKTAFLGNMSHELRTPLNAVIGFADLLEAQPDAVSPRGREYVQHIRAAGGLLLDMVDQTLRLANFDAGSQAQLIRTHDLCRIVPDAIERRSERVRNRQVRVHPPVDGGIMVDCDEAFARQALVHVLDDALRRTPQDSAIAIRYLCEDTHAGVAVDEPGASFTQSAAARAFDPFWRPGSHLTRSGEGAGLGLPLAKLLVEAAGGTIALAPGEGGGMRVTLTFPRSAIGAASLAAAG